MTYTLRFLPEVEEDAIVGYRWYEKNLLDSVKILFGCFIHTQENLDGIRFSAEKYIMNFDVVFLEDSHMLSI